MLRNFLTAECCFLLLVLCCVMCHFTPAATTSQVPQNTIALLNPDKPEFVKESQPEPTKYESFTFPSLYFAEGLLVVFARAKHSTDSSCDIVEGHFNLMDNAKLTDVFDQSKHDSVWKKEIVFKNSKNFCVGGPSAVDDKKKIYVFLKKSSCTESSNDLEYGVIKSETIDNKQKEITWGEFTDLKKDKIKPGTDDFKNAISVASGGPGIAIKNSLVVPLWYETTGKKSVSTIMKKATTTTGGIEWELVKSNPSVEGIYPAIVEWESNKLILMISCSNGHRKVYESDNMGEKWTEAIGSISGVWRNTKESTDDLYGGRFGFIKADIDIDGKKTENVMFVTQPVKTVDGKYNLHLWMTDNRRVSLA